MSTAYFKEYFRPCIDIHEGQVKQIIGSTLGAGTRENYVAHEDSLFFADGYAEYGLTGGHIIMLDRGGETESAARRVVERYPKTYQVGGGMNLERGREWVQMGAEKIILSSCLFPDGCFDPGELEKASRCLGRDHLVVDLSALEVDGEYRAAIHGWKTVTDFSLTRENLTRVGDYCDEILVHAIAREGMRGGMDGDLLALLSEECPVPFVYAGGVASLEEVRLISERSQQSGGKIGFTIGSSLDVFGGDIPLKEVLAITEAYRYRPSPLSPISPVS